MKVYCIDDTYNGGKVNLTIGKFYEVLHKQHFEVTIRNDRGKRAGYGMNRFATPEQYRDIQLNKILTSE